MTRRSRHNHTHDDWGQGYEVVAALIDGPRTLDEIVGHFEVYIRRLGFFASMATDWREGITDLHENLAAHVEDLEGRGWVSRDGDRYALTAVGRERAGKVLSELERTGRRLGVVARPETVSLVSLGAHLGLAALKLPAGILSGSVGLINDALDTLLDGLSSLLVWAGFRFDRERQVNVVLVILMLATGLLTLYHAVERLFVPFEPEVDAFTFAATLISALLCGVLYLYQRFVGVNSGSMALITQSVDSRNHVIVAASVTAGLIAALVRFPLLDILVGLAVAILILKSAVELAVELWKAMGEDEVDLSAYGVPLIGRLEAMREEQLRDWMLYLVDRGEATTREALTQRASEALDFGDHPSLRALGLEVDAGAEVRIAGSLAALFTEAWVTDEEPLALTEAGRAHLGASLNPRRRHGHRRNGDGRRRRREDR